jgi:hypothetical protein
MMRVFARLRSREAATHVGLSSCRRVSTARRSSLRFELGGASKNRVAVFFEELHPCHKKIADAAIADLPSPSTPPRSAAAALRRRTAPTMGGGPASNSTIGVSNLNLVAAPERKPRPR